MSRGVAIAGMSIGGVGLLIGMALVAGGALQFADLGEHRTMPYFVGGGIIGAVGLALIAASMWVARGASGREVPSHATHVAGASPRACPACGAGVPPSALYCNACGARQRA